MIWRVSILFLAYWLLAAHFLRGDNIVMVVVLCLSPLLVFSKNEMALRLLQVVLVLAVFTVWLPSTFSIAEYRIATENPWFRMVVIMVAVMVFNLFAAWSVSGLIRPNKKIN